MLLFAGPGTGLDCGVIMAMSAQKPGNSRCPLVAGGVNRRVGIIFPLQAAVSLESKKATDRYFQRYAQAAFMSLCSERYSAYRKSPPLASSEFTIFDFYSENTIIAIFHKPLLEAQGVSLNVDALLPAFAKRGYFLQLEDINPSRIVSPHRDDGNGVGSSINLRLTSGELIEYSFIKDLLARYIPYAESSLLKFFYWYQIIELLINLILENSFTAFKVRLSAATPVASGIRDILDDLQTQMSEKKRVSRLFSEHVSAAVDLDELRRLCNDFLILSGHDANSRGDERGPAEFLYPVRNKIFHNLREIHGDSLKMLEDLVAELGSVVCDVLTRFSSQPSAVARQAGVAVVEAVAAESKTT